jgi:hypothetical protein
MLSVYVWTARIKSGIWGHASMQVDQTYISWWPEGEGRIRSKIHPSVYAAHPIRNQSFEGDVAGEGGQQPHHVIVLKGLDETAIKDWWQIFGLTRDGTLYEGPLLAWDTLMRNCSNVVATALKAGGGDKFAAWHKSRHVVWTPSDVLAYALAISTGLDRG